MNSSKTKPALRTRFALWVANMISPEVKYILPSSSEQDNMIALGNEVIRLQKDIAHWRDRTLSAEAIVSYHIPNAFDSAVKKHDSKYNTTLHWRF